MSVLLPEIWAQVCLLLQKRDLSALSSSSRFHHEIAAPWLYRSLCIRFRGPESLWEAISEVLEERTAGRHFLQFARRLDLVCLKPPWPGTEKGEQYWKLKDWGLEYLRSSTCVAGLGFPIDEPGSYPSAEWDAVLELLSRLHHLEELHLIAQEVPFQSLLLDAIAQHHPACSINIWAFQCVEFVVPPSSAGKINHFNFTVLHSESVRTLSAALLRKYKNLEDEDYIAEVIPYLVNAPNLKHLIIRDENAHSDVIEELRPGWKAAARQNPAKSTALLESLTFIAYGQPLALLPEIAAAADLSHLKSLDLALDRNTQHVLNVDPALVSLERLFIVVSPVRLQKVLGDPDFNAYVDSEVAISIVLAFRPLKYLCLRGLGRHRIFTVSSRTTDEHYVADIALLADACPSLEELRLQLRRFEGSRHECDVYKALGRHLLHVRTLILDLHFDPRERGAHQNSLCLPSHVREWNRRQGQEEEYNDEEAEDNPAFFRPTLINAATDKVLALGIWNLIASAQESRRLRNLRIVPFGFDLYSTDVNYYLIFLARSFLVSRFGVEIPTVEEIGRMAWTVWQEDLYGPGEPCILSERAEEVVAGLWPELVGRDEWSNGWTSFPLQIREH